MPAPELTWVCKPFNQLTNYELYAMLRLRSEVFVVEQNCVFLDMDNKDQDCWHLLGYYNSDLAVSARLLAPGKPYAEMSIGRVVSSPEYRKSGFGRALMETAIEKCYELFGKGAIKIGGQLYLKKFYESLGFIQTSDIYLEDDIEHIEMVKAV